MTTPPDCATCIYKNDCPRARPNLFCTAWASSPATVPNEPAPSTEWQRGEDTPYLYS